MSVATANQQIVELHRVREMESNYAKTLLLLRLLKSGEVTIDDFSITENGWTLVLPNPQQDANIAP